MSNTYKLVNPYIKGEDFTTKVDAKNSLEAAKSFYNALSEHFSNNVPQFYFTIQKGGSKKGKFYHFLVKEKKNKNDEVDFSIAPFEIQGEEESMKQYLENFDHFKGRYNGKKGSKRSSRRSSRRSSKRSDKISSESSDNFYREAKSYVPVTSSPFYYMYYDPLVYKVDSVFIPTYYAYVSAFSEINTRNGLTYYANGALISM